MSAQQSLARLRFEDPQAAAAAAEGLWAQLAIEDPRMFAALWRRANKPSRRAAHLAARAPEDWTELLPAVETNTIQLPAIQLPAVEVPAVEVPAVEVPAVEVPAVEPEAPRFPVVNLAQSAIVLASPSLMPSPELLPALQPAFQP
jgi:hypothetical protein